MPQIIEGTLTLDDARRHIPHSFDVPPGAKQISIRFDYNPKQPAPGRFAHEVSISLFDPETGRGARHCNPDQAILLTPDGATPGYTPGPLTPGEWTVFIDTHRILPPGGVRYTLEIDVSTEPSDFRTPVFQKGATAPRGPGWYRGDLHGHTLHSDARWSVADFVAYARGRALDFVTLTDHNTVSALAECDSMANDDLLTLGGMELTTFAGHCLSIGPREWMDWRVRDGDTMADVAKRHMAAGGFYIIAHPMCIGEPFCSGCTWQYPDMMPGVAPAVEVWNGPWDQESNNEDALKLYYRWLNQGHRLVATAGSDTHGPFPSNARIGYNHVYAEALSEDAILGALRQGHSYVSSGPRLSLTVETADGNAGMMGDAFDAATAEIKASFEDCPSGAMAWLIAGGSKHKGADVQVLDEVSLDEKRSERWTVRPEGQFAWYAVEVLDPDGQVHALTNPVYFSRP
ncbi:CehA/McbA family metallohydrolase [Bauldia sp.]|uniref:CehA/McbA family metallohydrolase n=1 Tax=Bauldia sp. TaxID=2575872 RepID=UPI003BAAC2F3